MRRKGASFVDPSDTSTGDQGLNEIIDSPRHIEVSVMRGLALSLTALTDAMVRIINALNPVSDNFFRHP